MPEITYTVYLLRDDRWWISETLHRRAPAVAAASSALRESGIDGVKVTRELARDDTVSEMTILEKYRPGFTPPERVGGQFPAGDSQGGQGIGALPTGSAVPRTIGEIEAVAKIGRFAGALDARVNALGGTRASLALSLLSLAAFCVLLLARVLGMIEGMPGAMLLAFLGTLVYPLHLVVREVFSLLPERAPPPREGPVVAKGPGDAARAPAMAPVPSQVAGDLAVGEAPPPRAVAEDAVLLADTVVDCVVDIVASEPSQASGDGGHSGQSPPLPLVLLAFGAVDEIEREKQTPIGALASHLEKRLDVDLDTVGYRAGDPAHEAVIDAGRRAWTEKGEDAARFGTALRDLAGHWHVELRRAASAPSGIEMHVIWDVEEPGPIVWKNVWSWRTTGSGRLNLTDPSAIAPVLARALAVDPGGFGRLAIGIDLADETAGADDETMRHERTAAIARVAGPGVVLLSTEVAALLGDVPWLGDTRFAVLDGDETAVPLRQLAPMLLPKSDEDCRDGMKTTDGKGANSGTEA